MTQHWVTRPIQGRAETPGLLSPLVPPLTFALQQTFWLLSPDGADKYRGSGFLSSKYSNTFRPKVFRGQHELLSPLSSAPQHDHGSHTCQVLGDRHLDEPCSSADAKQKVSSKEAPSVKHMKGELTGVQAKYWNIAVKLKTLFQRNKDPL